uniref:Uncharacterized protein n=1 Tax=Ciona savignyi TaxID=51511 RepID=H2ZMS8_CIOSA
MTPQSILKVKLNVLRGQVTIASMHCSKYFDNHLHQSLW